MPANLEHQTKTITGSSVEILGTASSKRHIDIIDIFLSVGDATIHKTDTAAATNTIAKAGSPGKVIYPGMILEKGEVLHVTGANTPTGTVNVSFTKM